MYYFGLFSLFLVQFSNLYFVAFGGILIGLITYNVRPPPAAPPKRNKKTRLENGNGGNDGMGNGGTNNDYQNNKYPNYAKGWTESSFKPTHHPQENGNTIYFHGNNGHLSTNPAPLTDGQGNIDVNSSLIGNRTGPNGHYSSL